MNLVNYISWVSWFSTQSSSEEQWGVGRPK